MTKLISATLLFASLPLIGFDKVVQPETTTYSLRDEDLKEAAILWLKSKNLSTNGNVSVRLATGNGDYKIFISVIKE